MTSNATKPGSSTNKGAINAQSTSAVADPCDAQGSATSEVNSELIADLDPCHASNSAALNSTASDIDRLNSYESFLDEYTGTNLGNGVGPKYSRLKKDSDEFKEIMSLIAKYEQEGYETIPEELESVLRENFAADDDDWETTLALYKLGYMIAYLKIL
jgi:hypothetical protein